MKKCIVAIQGIRGSYHHVATKEYFVPEVEVMECLSFDRLVRSIVSGDSTDAVMAIENSIAGSLIPNYALIDRNHLHIVGEHYLNIHHNLMALPGQDIADIREVYSHPMALLQCAVFFDQYPHIKLVEDADTAEVAKRIADKGLKGVGAVASREAAKLYGLQILQEEIQTIKNNATRFVVLHTENSSLPGDEVNKASLKFLTEHKRGSLATVLNVMSDCKMNLTKIQSIPVIETPWKYEFFVDVTFDTYRDFRKMKSILSIMVENFKILGEYKNARS